MGLFCITFSNFFRFTITRTRSTLWRIYWKAVNCSIGF